jgi:hypothetical protein
VNRGRRWASAIVAALAFVVAGGALETAAQAVTAYRYWAYYVGSGGQWHYSSRGPAFEHPSDGEVQGWRFATQSESGAATPRVVPDFAALCGSTPPQAAHLRVGLVIDFGVAADAPPGDTPPSQIFSGCVSVPATKDGVPASGFDVLTAAVGTFGVRVGSGNVAGLVCGIRGYPTTECADVVRASKPSPTPTPSSPSTRQTATTTTTKTPTPTPTPQTSPNEASTSAPVSAAAAASGAADSATTPIKSAPLSALRMKNSDRSSDFPLGPVIGGVAAVGLAIAALVISKKKRES